METQGQFRVSRVVIVLVSILLLYNIGSGLIVKRLGIPGIFDIEFGEKATPSQPQPQPQPQPQAQPQPQPQTSSTVVPTPPTASSFVQPQALPHNTCPQVPGMFYLPYPNTWYGPFDGFALAWERSGGFYVWNPFYNATVPFPDPYSQVQRNTWLRLPNAPFNICVDSFKGNVFAQYVRE